MYLIKIYTGFLDAPIELKATNPNSVIHGQNEFKNAIGTRVQIIDTNYYLSVHIDEKIRIDWNRGKSKVINVKADKKSLNNIKRIIINLLFINIL